MAKKARQAKNTFVHTVIDGLVLTTFYFQNVFHSKLSLSWSMHLISQYYRSLYLVLADLDIVACGVHIVLLVFNNCFNSSRKFIFLLSQDSIVLFYQFWANSYQFILWMFCITVSFLLNLNDYVHVVNLAKNFS